MKELFTFTAYYGSFLAFPFLAGTLWLFLKKRHLFLTGFLILLSLSFIWSRFVEPQMIVIREVEGPANFVLISDQHLGQYKGEAFFSRVVERINELDPDFVLIPGDFVYSIDPTEIEAIFTPFKSFKMPVYAVLGNHDMAPAGELLDSTLSEILSEYGVTWIDNATVINNEIQILGLGERWNNETDLKTFDSLQPDLINIAVIHNPDGAYDFPENSLDLIVAGHTHGGQIRIPFLYKWAVPTKYDWGKAQGWFEILGNPLYITSGLGETALPMRLFNPPEIVHFQSF